MTSDGLANLSREDLVGRLQQAEKLVRMLCCTFCMWCVVAARVHLVESLLGSEGQTTIQSLLCLQLQQEQRKGSSLQEELKAAKEQNVVVVCFFSELIALCLGMKVTAATAVLTCSKSKRNKRKSLL